MHILNIAPCDIESKYGGVFFYGVHMVQQLMAIFGEDVNEVKVTRHSDHAVGSLAWESGYFATLIFTKKNRPQREILISRENGIVKLEPRIKDTNQLKPYSDMVEMFKTGKEPRRHESILACVAVLEALEKSVESQSWEKVIV